MVRVIFDGSNLRLDKFYQTGSGGIAYFEGLPLYQRGYGNLAYRQRGAGVGTILRNIWHYLQPIASSLKPIASSIGKEIGKEGLAATARVLNKVKFLKILFNIFL